MQVYKALRALAIAVRWLQVALLNLSWFTADVATHTGEKAKRAAHRSLDKREAKACESVYLANAALGAAELRYDEAVEDMEMSFEEISADRTLIDREVI